MILPITVKTWYEDVDTPYAQLLTSPMDLRVKYRVSNLCECPEDAIIGRDLVGAYEWLDAVRLGMELAREGITGFEVTDEIMGLNNDED